MNAVERRQERTAWATPEEVALWAALRAGAEGAREALFAHYTSFARQVARRRHREHGGQVEIGDVRQFAYAGLLESIDRFDPDLGAPFRAFASRRISGSIIDGVRKMTEVGELAAFRSRMRSDRVRSLRGAEADSPKEALDALVELAVGLAVGFILEDAASGAAEAGATADGYESLSWKETLARLDDAVSGLGDREQTIVRRHYLDGMDFEGISRLLGLSKGRVSQLHRAAISTLRKRLGRSGEFTLRR